MTREDGARALLSAHGLEIRNGEVAYLAGIKTGEAMIAACLAFADAEAAAMRERAADYLEGYAGGHHMAKSCAAAIRALPATGEVGRD